MPDWGSIRDRVGIDHLRGKHAETPAVIVGSGPSLRFVKGRLVKDRVVITVNSAAMAFPDADYYLSSDHGVVRTNHWNYVMRGTSHIILQYFSIEVQRRLGSDRVTIFQKDPGVWALDPNAKSLIFGFGSTHCAVHAAVIMGCSPIYLLGCDCQFTEGKRHYWQFPGFEPDDIDIFGKPEKEWREKTIAVPYGLVYPGEDGKTDNYLWESFNGWKAIHQSSPDVEILDASEGILDRIFPTASVDEALGTTGRDGGIE